MKKTVSVMLQNRISRSNIHMRLSDALSPPFSERYQAEMPKKSNTPILPLLAKVHCRNICENPKGSVEVCKEK